MAAIVFGGKSLRSSSSFGHEVWEVDIWMISNFSCLWRQGSALGLRLVMETERERSVGLFGDLFPPFDSLSCGWGSLLFGPGVVSWGRCLLGEWVSEGIFLA